MWLFVLHVAFSWCRLRRTSGCCCWWWCSGDIMLENCLLLLCGDLWPGACLFPFLCHSVLVIVLYHTPDLRFKMPLTLAKEVFLCFFLCLLTWDILERKPCLFSYWKNRTVSLFQPRLGTKDYALQVRLIQKANIKKTSYTFRWWSYCFANSNKWNTLLLCTEFGKT